MSREAQDLSWSNRIMFFGLAMAVIFYVVSTIYVHLISDVGATKIIDSDAVVINVAHWQLEDGFREGLNGAIKTYQYLKEHRFEEFRAYFGVMFIRQFYACINEYRDDNISIDFAAIGSNYDTYEEISEALINGYRIDALTKNTNLLNAIDELKSDSETYNSFVGELEQVVGIYQRRKAWVEDTISLMRTNTQPQKVRLFQTTVPVRAYSQWFRTQLVGGNPADIIQIRDLRDSQTLNQYFHPLGQYISEPNPYNNATVLEEMSWKESFIDDMISSFDRDYGDYYGVGTFCVNMRLFANVDMLEKITGSRRMPTDLAEWLDMCQQIRDYSIENNINIIPIGVRGVDKETIRFFFQYYFSQLNGNLAEEYTRCYYRHIDDAGMDSADVIDEMVRNEALMSRILSISDLIAEIGQYFSDGFTAMDLEQSKYQFFSERVVFLCEGTWNGYSLIKHSPFDVGVAEVPVIGHRHKLSHYYTGAIAESTASTKGHFGITNKTGNFDVALDFLQYMTSYEINQKVTEEAKWLSTAKYAEYSGLLNKFKPNTDGAMMVAFPFSHGYYWHSVVRYLETFENIINGRGGSEPREYFLQRIRDTKNQFADEHKRRRDDAVRSSFDFEVRRGQYVLPMDLNVLESDEQDMIQKRYEMLVEHHAFGTMGRLTERLEEAIRSF